MQPSIFSQQSEIKVMFAMARRHRGHSTMGLRGTVLGLDPGTGYLGAVILCKSNELYTYMNTIL